MSQSESSSTEKKIYTVRFQDGSEKYRFEVQTPYLAALNAARRLVDPNGFTDPDTAREENSERIYLRELGTRRLHVYKAWAWLNECVCPECGNRQIYRRKRKTPTFRCQDCKAEFDEPADSDEEIEPTTDVEATNLGRSRVPEDEDLPTSE